MNIRQAMDIMRIEQIRSGDTVEGTIYRAQRRLAQDQSEAWRINYALDAGRELKETISLLELHQHTSIPVCLVCGEDAIDGHCGCDDGLQ